MARSYSRYDLVLALVAVAFAGVVVVTAVTAVPMRASAAGAVVVAGGALYEGLVRNPPTPDRDRPDDGD